MIEMAVARRTVLLIGWLLACAPACAQEAYYPDANWQHRTPAESGLDAARLQEAIDFAIASESRSPRDQALAQARTFGRKPFGQVIGPMKGRGDTTGVVVHRGYIVAEWGEPRRVDMAHSVTKSLLSSVVGVAFDRGMIRRLDDPVKDYMAPIQASDSKAVIDLFDTPHNRTITWDHLLRQTSDWEGTLWGKPDWADRPSDKPGEWLTRPRAKPGTTWKYNDVRVNVLALAALQVWRRPLPQVLKDTVMDPIGASNAWRWHGYDNAFVVIDGTPMQSVSGGGHWGGGLFIDAYDPAGAVAAVGRRGAHAHARQPRVRVHELVQQPRPQALPARAGQRLRAHRQRRQPDRRGSG